MASNLTPPPPLDPTAVTVASSPSSNGATPPSRSRSPSGTVAELIDQHESGVLKVALVSIVVLSVLKSLPMGDVLKTILSPRIHLTVPIVLLYLSSRFGWRRATKVALLWLFGFSPVSPFF